MDGLGQHFREQTFQMIQDGRISVKPSELAKSIADAIDGYIDHDRLSIQAAETDVEAEIAAIIEMCLTWDAVHKEMKEESRQAAKKRAADHPSVLEG